MGARASCPQEGIAMPAVRLSMRRLLPVVLAAAAAVSAPAGSTLHAAAFSPRVPPGTLGINGQFLTNLGDGAPTAAQQNAQLDQVQALGIGVIRLDTSWDVIEPNAPDFFTGMHTYHWATLDSAATEMGGHGMRWAPIIDYSARWATLTNDILAPPRDDVAWSQFAGALAHRYGPGGDFWKANPSLPYLPVQTWEIWNEEKGGFWNAPRCETHMVGIDQGPQRYADLFMAARTAVRAVDPAAKLMVGGLVGLTTPGSDSTCTVQTLQGTGTTAPDPNTVALC
jgi:hypothetical protein